MDKGLLTMGEAAGFLSIGRSKLYELVATGQLPVVRIGRSVRVPTSSLERWIRERTAEAEGVREPA